MMKHTTLSLILAALCSASAFAAISPEQAISAAEKEGKGQAIGFKLQKHDGKSVYAVKLIGDKGFERLMINEEDGSIVVEKHPEFSAPAFSLRQALAEGEKLGKVVGIQYLDGKMPPPPHDGKAHDGKDNPPPHDGKARDGKDNPPPHDGKARDGKDNPPPHDGKAHDGKDNPPPHDGKAHDGKDNPPPHDGKARDGKGEAHQPIYLLMIEKDGKVEHHAISAQDGSKVEKPKGENPAPQSGGNAPNKAP